MFITPAQTPEIIMDIFKAGLVPMVTSSPGLGKSSIAKQIAKEQNLKLIDVRLAQCDPVDLCGFPTINTDRNRAGYIPMDTFPIEGDSLPVRPSKELTSSTQQPEEYYSGWLLLLDEFNSAPMAVQAAAYKLVLDKQVGIFNLHKRVVIMCAGNLDTDRAIVNRLSTAMQSRMIHLQLEPSHKDWLTWANTTSIDYRIIAWINFKNDALHKFDPKHSDKTFPCPRTWEFLSKIIKPWKEIKRIKMPVIAGTVGEGMAHEFMAFCTIFDNLPTISEIMSNPAQISIPTEPDILYAISGFLSNHINIKTINNLMIMIERLPIEFQIICLKGAISKDVALANTDIIDAWGTKNAHLLT